MLRSRPGIVGGAATIGVMAAGGWTTPSEHSVAAGLAAMHRVVDDLAGMSVGACQPGCLASMLVDVTRLQAKLAELTGRVAVAADRAGVGEDVGATSTAAWWAHTTAQTRPATARLLRLGRALDRPDHDQSGMRSLRVPGWRTRRS